MEGIYLMRLREFIKSKENVLKLGRSHTLDNRVKQYPNGSEVLLKIKCKNSIAVEAYLINLFKIKFTQKSYYGTEYFEGDEDYMIAEICKYINICNNSNKNNKKNKKEVKEKVKEVTDIDKYRTCPKCNYECKYPSLLKAHFRKSFHCLLNEEEINNYFNDNSIINNINKCNKCTKQFNNRQAYLRHKRETRCGKNIKT